MKDKYFIKAMSSWRPGYASKGITLEKEHGQWYLVSSYTPEPNSNEKPMRHKRPVDEKYVRGVIREINYRAEMKMRQLALYHEQKKRAKNLLVARANLGSPSQKKF